MQICNMYKKEQNSTSKLNMCQTKNNTKVLKVQEVLQWKKVSTRRLEFKSGEQMKSKSKLYKVIDNCESV